MQATDSIMPYQSKARASSQPLSNGSFCERGGRSITPASGGSAPSPMAGSISVPKSMASICITVSGSGIAPREKSSAINGTASAMLLLNTYMANLRMLA